MSSNRIYINDVSPRDGLQNQTIYVSVEGKLALIEALISAGVRQIEATSFVSPKAVPQMADADVLFQNLPRSEEVQYSALVPNLKGLQRAIAAGAKEIAVVLSATETMNQRNLGMTLARTLEVCTETVVAAKAAGLLTKAYVAVAFECPFEGTVSPAQTLALAAKMHDAGVDQIVVADTIGAAAPTQVGPLMREFVQNYGCEHVAAHLHDTRAMALANAYAAIEAGVRRFDSSAGGLGGCPFAPGAAGNLATEDIVLMAEMCGFQTGVSLEKLMQAVEIAETLTQRVLGGRSRVWLDRYLRKDSKPTRQAT